MTTPEATTPVGAAKTAPAGEPDREPETGRWRGRPRITWGDWRAWLFLLPALAILGALVVYPIGYTIWRSLFDRAGAGFVGLDNYIKMFTDDRTFTAVKNNAIWVFVAPTVVTALGLIFAVLTERIKWSTAFKTLIFMPMAISFLAAGVIFRAVYDEDPDRGILNAILVGIRDTFTEAAPYQGARPRDDQALQPSAGGFASPGTFTTADQVALGFVAVPQENVPDDAEPAAQPPAGEGLSGVVWLDFTPGGGGEQNVIDPNEVGLPGMKIEAVQDGRTVASTTTENDGTFVFEDLPEGEYTLRLPSSNFAEPFNGVTWLGPTLVTPSIIASYVWIWAGFAMVLIAAGLAAIPRDALEAARVDGATEWQVFRRVTVPLLAPVLAVVIVTLVINVLKIFDLVFIIAPSSTQPDANVLALQMWLVSFGGGNDQGLGSAIAVFLFLLVVPAMIFNIRRFRREQQR